MFITEVFVRALNSVTFVAIGPVTDAVGQKEVFKWLITKRNR